MGHANQGVVRREVRCVLEAHQNGKLSHVRVKGEFIGKPVPMCLGHDHIISRGENLPCKEGEDYFLSSRLRQPIRTCVNLPRGLRYRYK